MKELSTQEYNELYKKYFKEIFSKPMKDLGFKKKGTGKFCRLNKLGLFEYIGFFRYYQKLRLEYAIIPIYSNMMKNSIGNGGDTNFVDLDSEEKMEKGMKEILNEIENSIIPWFQKYERVCKNFYTPNNLDSIFLKPVFKMIKIVKFKILYVSIINIF
ncbi:hypothetical protein AB8B22_10945 (plasmid) [Leptotrichia sp. HSP-334]|uniref:Uncharacterized protein n=1 Tax=Leptotrichia rugosa TaxID=3239302 RepID=A0AB39VIF5_9FUSO